MNYHAEHHVTSTSGSTPPEMDSDVRRRVIAIVKAEAARQDRAEKLVLVESQNGYVHLPRSEQRIRTDRTALLLPGTDDHVFKEFIEGPLRKVEKSFNGRDTGAWTLTEASLGLGSRRTRAYRFTALGRAIVHCCSHYREEWGLAYVNHVFSPSVSVLLRALKRYAARINLAAHGAKRISGSGVLATLMNRFGRFVQRVFAHWPFINANRGFVRQARENFNSARDLIYQLAGKHSRLLLLRIDLYYKPYYQSLEANQHIHNFLRWIRGAKCKRGLLPAYLGFIIKRENGIVRGMHWHLMVICDGNLQHSGGYLSQMLGEEWARRTGQGAGSYYNCNSDREKYEYDGLGVLNLDDWQKMAGLRAALYYMSKQDCVLKVSNDKVRNFWRSPIRRDDVQKKGRPRMDSESLALLRRMLGGKRSKYPPRLVDRLRKPSSNPVAMDSL